MYSLSSTKKDQYYKEFVKQPKNRFQSDWVLQRAMAHVITNRKSKSYHINKNDILFCTEIVSVNVWHERFTTFKQQEQLFNGRKKTDVQIQIENLREYFQQLCKKDIQSKNDITQDEIKYLNADIDLFYKNAAKYDPEKNTSSYSNSKIDSAFTLSRSKQNSQTLTPSHLQNTEQNSQFRRESFQAQQEEQTYYLNTHDQQMSIQDQEQMLQQDDKVSINITQKNHSNQQNKYPTQVKQYVSITENSDVQGYINSHLDIQVMDTQIHTHKNESQITYDQNKYVSPINLYNSHNQIIESQQNQNYINSMLQYDNRSCQNYILDQNNQNHFIQNKDLQKSSIYPQFQNQQQLINNQNYQQNQINMVEFGVYSDQNIQQDSTLNNYQQFNQNHKYQWQSTCQQQQMNINQQLSENQHYSNIPHVNQQLEQNNVFFKNQQKNYQQQQNIDGNNNYTNQQQYIPVLNYQNINMGYQQKEQKQNYTQSYYQYNKTDDANPQDAHETTNFFAQYMYQNQQNNMQYENKEIKIQLNNYGVNNQDKLMQQNNCIQQQNNSMEEEDKQFNLANSISLNNNLNYSQNNGHGQYYLYDDFQPMEFDGNNDL